MKVALQRVQAPSKAPMSAAARFHGVHVPSFTQVPIASRRQAVKARPAVLCQASLNPLNDNSEPERPQEPFS